MKGNKDNKKKSTSNQELGLRDNDRNRDMQERMFADFGMGNEIDNFFGRGFGGGFGNVGNFDRDFDDFNDDGFGGFGMGGGFNSG